jgi:hypothetical protein
MAYQALWLRLAVSLFDARLREGYSMEDACESLALYCGEEKANKARDFWIDNVQAKPEPVDEYAKPER